MDPLIKSKRYKSALSRHNSPTAPIFLDLQNGITDFAARNHLADLSAEFAMSSQNSGWDIEGEHAEVDQQAPGRPEAGTGPEGSPVVRHGTPTGSLIVLRVTGSRHWMMNVRIISGLALALRPVRTLTRTPRPRHPGLGYTDTP